MSELRLAMKETVMLKVKTFLFLIKVNVKIIVKKIPSPIQS